MMYGDQLMEHYKYPSNRKKINEPSFTFYRDNPSCGDQMGIEGVVENNVLVDVGFEGRGCVISQASASMLTEKCKGLSLEAILDLGAPDMIELVGIELGPNRLKCALLCLDVLKRGIAVYLGYDNGKKDNAPISCGVPIIQEK